MADAVARPAEYVGFRDAAAAILTRHEGAAALDAFGFADVYADGAHDLRPAYAFLEAQGFRGASTPALGLLPLAGALDGRLAGAPLFGAPFGSSSLVAVPGLTPGATVVVDRPGSGLVAVADPAAVTRGAPSPAADDYLAVLDPDPAGLVPVVPDDEAEALRERIVVRARLGAAAELLGLTDRLLTDAATYAGQRQQFGRTLASYQAMQHLLAWAATDRHQLTCLFDIAVERSAAGPVDPELARAVKAMAGRVFHSVAQTAIQVTGAISFTWEHSLNRLHQRGMALDQVAGSSADLVAAIGRQARTEGVIPELFTLAGSLPAT
ncbi:acyl-CoA dehydrogenase family protein [Trujillonella endophytica]|uniref:Acyl-CoA dehydrogenase, C-terminal domain n=1 Tax=Trujillonella endophytica TaxID=673521 RepID=A0A1H8Q6S9_9ACTN|nr:acyl-CoA dehydrogenase family protein [Trujillella endophytica]SEO49473.1 Acyl-CoA dehydrogenase, C-terminal domain [Trujillella endophytica]